MGKASLEGYKYGRGEFRRVKVWPRRFKWIKYGQGEFRRVQV